MSIIKATVIGASGYSGAEVVRLLLQRDDVSIGQVIAQSSVGKRVEEIYPIFTDRVNLEFESLGSPRLGWYRHRFRCPAVRGSDEARSGAAAFR